jgi:hypothetical protein
MVYFYNSLVESGKDANKQGYVISSIADLVLAKKDFKDEKVWKN